MAVDVLDRACPPCSERTERTDQPVDLRTAGDIADSALGGGDQRGVRAGEPGLVRLALDRGDQVRALDDEEARRLGLRELQAARPRQVDPVATIPTDDPHQDLPARWASHDGAGRMYVDVLSAHLVNRAARRAR